MSNFSGIGTKNKRTRGNRYLVLAGSVNYIQIPASQYTSVKPISDTKAQQQSFQVLRNMFSNTQENTTWIAMTRYVGLFLLLILGLSLNIGGSIESAHAVPCPPVPDGTTTACSSESPQSKKWHPGHYMQILRADYHTDQSRRFSYYDSIASNPDIEGVSVFFRWSQLETEPGNYSAGISLIRSEVTKLQNLAVPKRLIINMLDRPYGSSCSDYLIPYYPIYIIENASTHLYEAGGGCIWKRWNANTMDRYIALMTALGTELDDEPMIEMVSVFHETALNWGGEGTAPDFSEQKLAIEMQRLAEAMRIAWPSTVVRFPTNWGLNGTRLADFIGYLASIGLGAGNPDTCPSVRESDGATCGQPADKIMRGEIGDKDYRGEMPHVMGVEASELGLNSVGPYGGFTVQEIFNYANDQQRSTHILWDRNTFGGVDHSDPTIGQRWDAMLNLFQSHPVSETDCPKSILSQGGCR